jgi:hypothetical protein
VDRPTNLAVRDISPCSITDQGNLFPARGRKFPAAISGEFSQKKPSHRAGFSTNSPRIGRKSSKFPVSSLSSRELHLMIGHFVSARKGVCPLAKRFEKETGGKDHYRRNQD